MSANIIPKQYAQSSLVEVKIQTAVIQINYHLIRQAPVSLPATKSFMHSEQLKFLVALASDLQYIDRYLQEPWISMIAYHTF